MAGGDAPHLWIVGPGRLGLALGLALHRAGAVSALTYTGRRRSPPDHPLFRGPRPPATYGTDLSSGPAPGVVLLAVPDGRIAEVATRVAAAGPAAGTVALHASGALGSEALRPLADAGCSTGSLHPLVALPDPERGAAALRGAWFGVEGDADAVGVAERLVEALDGRVLRVDPGAKPLYHAAAVLASNCVVALLAVAERWAGEAGVDPGDARAALAALAAGAAGAAGDAGPVDALTGPVSRGDVETVRLHLSRLLSPPDRALYSVLATTTLEVARRRGLDAGAAARLEQALAEAE